jgi:hypothetical protein
VVWFGLLGWNPPLHRIVERGPYGIVVPAFAFLTYLAVKGWSGQPRMHNCSDIGYLRLAVHRD